MRAQNVRRAVGAGAALLAVHLGALGAYTQTNLEDAGALTQYEGRPRDTPGRTWLVVGSDSRAELTREEREEYATGDEDGERTDTIILVHVSESGSPTLVSLPRDSNVPVPGHGRQKLNAASALGGPELLVQTVESVSGLRVDSYLEVGLKGVVTLTDAVGGVETCLEEALVDPRAGVDLPAGCSMLEGREALGYVRSRYQDPRGDLGRIQRQQSYLSTLVSEATGARTLLDPVRHWRLARAGTDALAVDGAGTLELVRLGQALRGLGRGEGTLTTVPVADPDFKSELGSSVKWDREQALMLFAALKEDRPIPSPGEGGQGRE